MRIINDTPFKITTQGVQGRSQKAVSFIVKGTFALVPDGACTIADDQRDLAADTPYMDEIGRSLAWASDLVAFKPHTDFYIHGACHAPGGMAVPSASASFELGPLKKEIIFHGPRHAARRQDGSWAISEARPVTSVPLRWEYALGGLNDPVNPMGRGREEITARDGAKLIPLPLLEYPNGPWRGPKDRSPPANFGPVPISFLERRRKNGTRDQRWATFRAPLPPEDFDISINNAAPGDQQAGNAPRGDESLILRNLHPQFPVLTTALPGLRLRLGILRRVDGEVVPEEVPMRIDTIVALPEDDQLVLVWRGQAVRTPGVKIPEFAWMHCLVENMADEPSAFEALGARMVAQFKKESPPSEADYDKAIAKAMKEIRAKATKLDLPPALAKSFASPKADPEKLLNALAQHLIAKAEAIKAAQKS
jgi:hypothetical protein